MSNESLTQAQVREAERIAELEVRRYFDYYLKEVFPRQQRCIQDYADGGINIHNLSKESHGRVELRVNRFVWIVVGTAISSGAGGAGLFRLLLSFSG